MKKISIILCLIVMILVGCSNNKTFDELDVESEHNESQTALESEPVQKLALTSMSVENGYSDGYAWMRINSDEYSSLVGIVNKDGEVIAAFPTKDQRNYNGHSEFENGYAIIYYDTEVEVLDTNGDIVSTQQLGEDNRLVAYGSGYIVIENHIHDFDYSSYEYIIYNPAGEEITKFVSEDGESKKVIYMGGGVFCFDDISLLDRSANDIYFAKTNKWIQKEIGYAYNDVPVVFGKSDKRVIDCYKNDTGWVLTILDKDGNVTEYSLSLKPQYTGTIIANSLVSDNYCLIVDDDSLSVLDLNSGQQSKMDDTYFDKVSKKGTWLSEFKIYIDNDMFSIPLWGDDGEFYIGLFDMNFNLVCDPIRVDTYRNYSFADGRVAVKQEDAGITEVYSIEGEKLYTVNEVGGYGACTSKIQGYSDNVFLDVTSNLENIQVYDLDGNIPYTTLDTSNTKILSYK